VKESPSWEAGISSASQKIPHILMNPTFHYYICKSLTIFPILSQKNPNYVLSFNLLKICFSITLPCTPQSSTWSLSFRIPHVNTVRISLLPHASKRSGPRCVSFTNTVNFSCKRFQPSSNSKMVDHPLAVYCGCLFDKFAPPSETWNLRMCRVIVQRTDVMWIQYETCF